MVQKNLDLKKVGANIKKGSQQLKGKIVATVKKVGAVAADAALIPIFPLLVVMKKMLKDKGIKHPSDNTGTVKAFHQTFIKPRKSFDSQRSNLIEDVFSIVKDVIKFFAAAKKKKDAGKADKEELIAVGLANKIATTPAPAEPKTAAVSLSSNKNLMIIGGLAVIVIVFVMMKKK
jgi:hypothetical protein